MDVMVRTYVGNFPSSMELPEGALPSIRRHQGAGAEDWRCEDCLGSGIVPRGSSDVSCRACGGTGVVHGLRQAMFIDNPDAMRAVETMKAYLGGKRVDRDIVQFLLLSWGNESNRAEGSGSCTLWCDPAGIVLGMPDNRPPKKDGRPRGLPLWNARSIPGLPATTVEGPRAFGVAVAREHVEGKEVASGTLLYAAVRNGGLPPRIVRLGDFAGVTVSKKRFPEQVTVEWSAGGRELATVIGREAHVDEKVVLHTLVDRALALTYAKPLFSYLPRR